MIRLLLYIAVAFLLIHWFTAGQDEIVDPTPIYPTTNVERTP